MKDPANQATCKSKPFAESPGNEGLKTKDTEIIIDLFVVLIIRLFNATLTLCDFSPQEVNETFSKSTSSITAMGRTT